MNTDSKMSETEILKLLEEYGKTVEEIQEEFLSNVNQYILSNEISNKALMNAIIQITILNDHKTLDSKVDEKLFNNIFANISKFVPLFAETCKEIPAQIELLDGILEFFVTNRISSDPETQKRVQRIPKLIKCLYDFEILSSSAIMDWYESETSKQEDVVPEEKRKIQQGFMKQIKSFIAWLETPSDDDDNEDD